MIHTREAWDDTFAILAAEGVPERTVFHCFTGGPDEARARARRRRATCRSAASSPSRARTTSAPPRRCAPSTRLLVETDSPFLAPVPHRGEPNRPAFVPLVGAAVAAARGVDEAEVEAATWANTERVFALDPAR